MAYIINLTNGTIFATIADGTINTSSSMVLVGKNYAGYGEFLDENFIHLLENSADTAPPGAPLTGQLWWDANTNVLKVYNGTLFKVICSAAASASAPTSNVVGDLWFDTTNAQLKVYTGTTFLLADAFSIDNKKRDVDGGYVQATYVLPTKTKIGVSYGVANLDRAGFDSATSVLVKSNERTTVGLYHPLTKSVNLVAEYNSTEAEAQSGVTGKAKGVSLGGILFF